MPGPPRRYPTNAARQRAYRQRCREASPPAAARGGVPGPAVPPLPGPARWRALLRQARGALQTVYEEMEAYYEERSPAWQESERGAAFQERLEAVQEAQQAVEELDD